MRESLLKKAALLLIFAVSGLCEAGAQDAESSGVERYAIFVGSNEGGSNTQRLLYAGSDAMAFQKTMNEIGGIPKSNGLLLLNPTKDQLDEAMQSLSELISRRSGTSKRSEFLFYYSGHSDENALLLGSSSYDYSGLKAAISNIPSDVHVVILDSCYSGNFIRTKGGQKKKPFLLDDSSVVKGHAYLSSSSSQEYSQESDEIGSSFFTNAMLTGLRGAADSSGDKKVTLNELYSYAFNETLSKTENSSAGPQHPNYNITLVGSGDLVLSDISSSDSVVMLSQELKGRVILRDKNGKLVSEINKSGEKPLFLALEKGDYSATLIAEAMTMQGSFTLASGKVYELSGKSLSPVTGTFNRVRGSEDAGGEAEEGQSGGGQEALALEGDSDIQRVPFEFSFAANEISRHYGKKILAPISIGIIRSSIFQINGVMAAGIGNEAEIVNGLQAAGIYNIAGQLHGVQGAGIFNISESGVQGAQGAGIFNLAGGDISGVQAAGIFNIGKNFNGAQAAGIFNIAKDFHGLQAATIFNMAGSYRGLQAAPILNIAGKAQHLQISAIANVASELGRGSLQIGLVNIAGESHGFQLGLINFSRNGIFEIGTSYTTNNNLRFVLNSGSPHLYSVFGFYKAAGDLFRFDNFDQQHVTVILGLGKRITTGSFNFDFEGLANEVLSKTDDNKDKDKTKFSTDWFPAFRFSAGYSPVKHLRLFAGAMLMFDFYNSAAFDKVNNYLTIDAHKNFKIHPEFDFGARFSIN